MRPDFRRLYFTTAGRISRTEFWIGIGGLALAAIAAAIILAAVFGPTSLAARALVFVVELVLAYPAYAAMAKRFHDRARPGGTAVPAIVIPLLMALLRPRRPDRQRRRAEPARRRPEFHQSGHRHLDSPRPRHPPRHARREPVRARPDNYES